MVDQALKDDTRQQLVSAAEMLFAQHGLNNVSLRQVNVAAGQKNSGSVHYHFGSKDALLETILSRRMSVLDEERQTALVHLGDDKVAAADLLHVLSKPLITRVNQSRDWQYYVLVARELLEFRSKTYRPLWLGKFDGGAQEIYRRLKRHTQRTSKKRWQIAIDECTQVGLTLIADRAQKLLDEDAQIIRSSEDFAEHLIWLQEQILFGGDDYAETRSRSLFPVSVFGAPNSKNK